MGWPIPDVSDASYYIHKNGGKKVAEWGTAKKKKKKRSNTLFVIEFIAV